MQLLTGMLLQPENNNNTVNQALVTLFQQTARK